MGNILGEVADATFHCSPPLEVIMLRKHILMENGQVILAENMTTEEVNELATRFFEGIGGAPFFHRLATRFYELVTVDEELAGMFEGLPAEVHAQHLADHFVRMYGTPDLSEGWSVRFVRVHTTRLFSNQHRRRWLDLMRRTGIEVAAPEPWFSDMMGTLVNASGAVLGISRGAAMMRGEGFDREGYSVPIVLP